MDIDARAGPPIYCIYDTNYVFRGDGGRGCGDEMGRIRVGKRGVRWGLIRESCENLG